MSFLSELKRRRVFRVAVLYGVTAWILTEVSSVVMPALLLPEWTLTFVIVLLILGFPVAMILAWVFDIGPGGIERTAPVATIAAPRGRRAYLVYGLLLLGATVALSGVLYLRGMSPERAVGPRNSIAVLPFDNLSGDESRDYFGDGMAEELLNVLANVPGLNVAARISSFAYRGQRVDVRQVGRELGVETVLEGSVRWAGEDRVRITAQLVDTSSGYHIWSETYDRRIEDILVVQDEIARQIVDALKLHLTPAERADVTRMAMAETADTAAWELYQQGRHVWKRRGEGAIRRSIELFQAAIARDPGYARAHAALAASYVLIPDYTEEPPDEPHRLATAAALQALSLNANLGEAHAVLALIAVERGEWLDAEFKFLNATALEPKEPTPHQWYSNLLSRTGRLDAALAEARKALELDPTSPILAVTLADLHSVRGDGEQALEYAQQAEQLGLGTPLDGVRVSALLRLGRYDEARPLLYALGEQLGLTPEQMDLYLSVVQDPANPPAVLQQALQDRGVPPEAMLSLALMSGDNDAAYAVFERAERPANSSLVMSMWLPEARKFRRDPRFAALAERLGLFEYWKHYGWPDVCEPADGGLRCR